MTSPSVAPAQPLRLAFMGSAAFSLPTLAALVAAGYDVAAVYTQPPRPACRGQQPRRSPVHTWADGCGLNVRTPAHLRGDDEQRAFTALELDAAVVAAYGLILPKPILEAPRLGCLNVHGSLLPRWRGAAPIERAILAGDDETGITIMQMDAGLDTGAMLLTGRMPIGPHTTAAELHERLPELGAALLLQALDGVAAGTLPAMPQPPEGATYAKKLLKDEGRLDWARPAAELERAVRALNPQPGVWFAHSGERIKVLVSETADGAGESGEVVDDRLTVACGVGALRPLLVQRAGRAPAETQAFLRGYPLPVGTRLGLSAGSAGGGGNRKQGEA